MFPWNIAKSAEAMFSRWAVKRICKFLLKKKLGKFILGDIDLNQLDVQLSAGTIQLSDLAINVDYLNQKFGPAATVTVKEGSIGSLVLTMPWKGNGCRIEVDEFELVVAPNGEYISHNGSEKCSSTQDDNRCNCQDSGKLDHSGMHNAVKTSPLDVHEGVKTIAKMVKWLLTKFHVKVRKLIVAFDPHITEENKEMFGKTLVLRVIEAEWGTCISEDANLESCATVDSFLGLSQMTNILKFEGAVLEFLQMNVVDSQKPSSEATLSEWSRSCPSRVTTPIVTGRSGGFSGNLRLCIPWKNGALDIHKVDADAYTDPVELRFQPSTIRYFIYLWDTFKDAGKESKGHMSKETESIYYNAQLNCDLSAPASTIRASDKLPQDDGIIFSNCSSSSEKEPATNVLLSESHLISDWVSRNQRERPEDEPDFGASVEQFFECFDGLRNSQSAVGSSGMWNWTRSVFSAITAASSLASGSLHMPSDQQRVITNLKATISRISVFYSFVDGDRSCCCGLKVDQKNAGLSLHLLGAEFQSLNVLLQVSPLEKHFEATLESFELADHFPSKNDIVDLEFHGCSDNVESLFIQKVQDAVQGTLPSFSLSSNDTKPEGLREVNNPSEIKALNSSIHKKIKGICKNNLVRVVLLKTLGNTSFQVRLNSGSSGNSVIRPRYFSLKLPPFIFWVNFELVSMMSDHLKDGNFLDSSSTKCSSSSQAFDSSHRPSYLGDEGKHSQNRITTTAKNESMRGDIFVPVARIILWFPSKNCRDCRSYCSYGQFIALEISSPWILGENRVQAFQSTSFGGLGRKSSLAASSSLNLNLLLHDLDVYIIASSSAENAESNADCVLKVKYTAARVLSINEGTGGPSVISMHWQESPLTGPMIVKRAKLLASSENARSREKCMGKGCEFASVTTVKDVEDFDACIQQEMIDNSRFSLHVQLSPIMINLWKSQYEALNLLLHQMLDYFSCVASVLGEADTDSSESQASIFVECDCLTISVSREVAETTKGPIQNEIPGSWHNFRLNIQKFELLSASNVGGIGSANFLWLAYGEGKLWGSVTGVPDEEFLLISCCNSTMGRGDGDGSNVLSSRLSGTDIIYFWDPQGIHNYTSITIRCHTIVAVGGRLDWLDAILSFFSLSSPEVEQVDDNRSQDGDFEGRLPCGSSFLLNLVDIGLSYEPYFVNHVLRESTDSKATAAGVHETMKENNVACLLAASTFKISYTSTADSIVRENKISVQDLGLLLCSFSGPRHFVGNYSVENLRKIGYVKVAQEAHVEAILRVGENGHPWEIECLESHILFATCHDTTSALIHLMAQLQQIFTPDVEESLIHLQTRWEKVNESNADWTFDGDSAPSSPLAMMSSIDTKRIDGVVNLMDEICEDAFQLDGNKNCQSDISRSHIHMSLNGGFLGKTYNLSIQDSESFLGSFPLMESSSMSGSETTETSLSQTNFPGVIEEYFLSDLRPLSELSFNVRSTKEIRECKTGALGGGGASREKGGWYGDSSIRILENHVSEVDTEVSLQEFVECETSSLGKPDAGNIKGRVLLKNMNATWRMYGGSDWQNSQETQHLAIAHARDTSVCLELQLTGMNLQYDIFPEGGISVSRLSLTIQDFHLDDNSKDAPWKLVLGYYHSRDRPRKSSSKAFKLDLEAVRPDPSIPLEEYRLRIGLLPMLLHLHQSQLDYLINFFGRTNSSTNASKVAHQDLCESGMTGNKVATSGGHSIIEEALLPYFQKFDMWPLLIRVDYSPCHVDLAALRGGKYVELVNLVPWKGVELQLKHVQAVGVYGWSSVCETIIGEWLEDISQNQIHKLLKGLPPIRTLVTVGSGAAQLVSLPVKSYKNDHKLLKGMQRGTVAFLRSISREAIGLGVHLAAGAHDILHQAEYILASIQPSVPWPVQNSIHTRSNQPKDVRQGFQQACESISDGLGKSASALVQTPIKRYQRGVGLGSALAGAVQAAPAAALAPASAVARALHCTLLGARNSLDPEHKKESLDKYLGSTQHHQFK